MCDNCNGIVSFACLTVIVVYAWVSPLSMFDMWIEGCNASNAKTDIAPANTSCPGVQGVCREVCWLRRHTLIRADKADIYTHSGMSYQWV